MNIKLGDIANAQSALAAIINTTDDQPRRFKRAQFGRRMGNLIRQIEPHLKQWDELTQAIYAEHGTKSKDGLAWSFVVTKPQIEDNQKPVIDEEATKKNLATVNEALIELGSDEIVLDHLPMTWAWLDEERIELTAAEILALMPFMEE